MIEKDKEDASNPVRLLAALQSRPDLTEICIA